MLSTNILSLNTPRPLPVVVLADTSGSMSRNGKIDTLNLAVAEMIRSFAEEESDRVEIQVAVITFGKGGAALHQPLTPAHEIQWTPLVAEGKTPMGEALNQARRIVEDMSQISRRAFKPALVLVSDGVPTDDWRSALDALLASERGAKACRFALGIGAETGEEVLEAFVAGTGTRVFQANEVRQIRKFFTWVTMSITSRSRSVNPNQEFILDLDELEDFPY